MTPFAEARGLTVRHIGRRAPALRELDLRWEEGERLLLLGPSGAGKSTLALCLDGVIPHALDAHWEAGEVCVRGRDTRAASLAATTQDVGLVFQDPEAQLVTLAVDDEIAFGLENLAVPRDEMRERVARARTEIGLVGERVPERIDRLSGGSKQRLAIASVLAMRPGGMVLDEPTANLDPAAGRAVVTAMSALAADRSRSLLLIEHRIDDILPLIDRVAVMDGSGHLAFEAPPEVAFGDRLDELTALGAWAPQLALLGRRLGTDQPPRTVTDAADAIVRMWPAAETRDPEASARGAAVLRAERVTHTFRGSATSAVDDVSLDVYAGDVLAIVGANGAGKTTLALALAGALRPGRGRVLMGPSDIREMPPREIGARVAYVFQYPEHQFIARTARDELLVTLRARGYDAAEARRRADEALDGAGLTLLALADPRSLSHGQKRRLSVATALVADPEIVILDEPTFGQDRRHAEVLADRIRAMARDGRAVVIVTHDMALVADVGDRVAVMSEGRLVFEGAPRDLFTRGSALRAWGLEVPPVATAFALARERRPEVPPMVGLRDLEAYRS